MVIRRRGHPLMLAVAHHQPPTVVIDQVAVSIDIAGHLASANNSEPS